MAALLPDGSLNVKLLSQEVNSNLDEDAKYKAVDDMKKRAIHMSKDYDEFKNFVACAQQKPLDRGEMDSLREQKGSWTQQKTRYELMKKGDAGGSGSLASHIKRKTKGLKLSKEFPTKGPKTGMEFDRDWRRHCKSTEDRYRYLMLVKAEVFGTVFKSDIDANILGGVIEALNYAIEAGEPSSLTPPLISKEEEGEEGKVEGIILVLLKEWSVALSGCGRFSLSMALLEEKQEEMVAKLRKLDVDFLVEEAKKK